MGNKAEQALAGHVSGQSNRPLSQPAHALTFDKVLQELGGNGIDGISPDEAAKRLEEFGKNELDNGPGVNPTKILVRQIANAMMLVLILGMGVSFGIGSYIEGGVVAGIIFLNIVIGFMQEYTAEKTMDSLRSLSSPTSSVIRNGNGMVVPTIHVVPGDMVELKTGDVVPADIRLMEVMNFETDEALLTGESLPVQKDADAVFDPTTGPGDRLNVAYSSSVVTKGRARGIVFATGMFTEIGSIAAELRKSNSRVRQPKRAADGHVKMYRQAQAWGLTMGDFIGAFLGVNVGTPLQRKLSQLAIGLFGIAVVFAIVVLAANEFSNKREVIIYAVATGLSMIPASLIVVLTITMAAGTKRMVERHVIVRKLNALEALGAVTDICSDKTGTLTQGRMVVKKAWIPSKGTYSVGESSSPFDPTAAALYHSHFSPREEDRSSDYDLAPDEDDQKSYHQLIADNVPLEEFLKVASLANLATVYRSTEGEGWKARGDPTEIAIQVFASRFDWNRKKLTEGDAANWALVAEYPFSSDVKKMSVVFRQKDQEKGFAFTKGAVERIIDSCINIDMDGSNAPTELSSSIKDEILANMESLAAQGLRVLALASKAYDGPTNSDARPRVESDLTFRGLVGLYDPPRPESKAAVKRCHRAGVGVHMLTGDHPGTALAIAKQIGIVPDKLANVSKDVADAMVTTAAQFDQLTDDEIDALPVLPLVIARCAPQTKVRMIDALHRREMFAAMTGDGVNDSPSLKRADVGIAMGQGGSDVAKDASDIILTDDNFASILNAVEEGRRIFDNIQKFVLHLLAQNIAQACTLLIGLAFKDHNNLSVFPLSPVEIMWVIMVTSGLPDMGLGLEVAAPDILQRPPQNLKRGIFTNELLIDMLVYGAWMSVLCLSSFLLVAWGFGDGDLGENCNNHFSDRCDMVFRARATTFVSMTWFSLFLAWELMNFRRSFFRMQPKSKLYFTQWMHDVWRNKFLFWSVMFGFVSIFVILYVPVINHDVFKHTGISWEWGIVIIEALLFFAGIECWKWGKRFFFRMRAKKEGGGRARRLSSVVFDNYAGIQPGQTADGNGDVESDATTELSEKV
ncbi:potassium/sodium efflux P-type ATPase, fungal-type [Rhinocladiella mackenziei CBS 650.93]|uniref:P-type Na(+) transporter n=1 Tax=Rhinocladiella mackenziei CBS 650.93 TaxID=1442369 RepID=A0A0D2IJ96_9EURO|nr:potassium/sodium efflux P-type ATPase, fungal-type [Rhinocladiella mackenziei CBS 650.93]KIX03336.1 potassium/sodium efflux P-type ATPase, fungal-type [Rhinocladiella mackenziei CBS 650.93]